MARGRIRRVIVRTKPRKSAAPYVIGVLAFLISLVALLCLVGPVTCSDGWRSFSIGGQGACSWHGGVDFSLQKASFVVSVLVGFAAEGMARRRISSR